MSNYVVLPKFANRFFSSFVGCLFLALILNLSPSSAYTVDTNVYAPPAYLTFQPPPAGGSYTDAVFGSAVKRLTNAMTMPDEARGSGVVTSIAPEYSSMTPFNKDNTRLLLTHFSYFGLYDGAGNFLRSLPFEINTSSEPRWSRTDANVIYYVSGNQLKQYNIGTNSKTVVHAFTEYTNISGKGESDICFDGNHFVLAGNGRYVFVYEISTDTKSPVFDTGGRGFDSLYITPNDNVTITWLTNGSSRYNGIELFDTNMNFLRQLTHAGGHMDVTRDVNGDEVLIWVNAADAQLQVPCEAGVTKVRLSDGKQTCIWKGDWSLAAHVSAPDGNGWVFLETYAPSDPIPPAGWNVYTNEFLQVKLDGSEVRRLAHHRSRRFNTYAWQPKLSTSRDGAKVVFGSNFGLQAILGYPTEYSDAYLIDITSTPPPVVFNASFLGVTGQDYVGTGNQLYANGNPDWHIQLQGLRGTPTKIRITSDTGGIWETPFNGTNWIVLPEYDATGNADLWFEPYTSQNFHVKVWYSDGSTDEADASSSGANPLVSITVTPANSTMNVGATQQFTATGLYQNGSTSNITASVAWSSSNAAIATINSAGLATGVGGGTANISATLSGITGSASVNVQATTVGGPPIGTILSPVEGTFFSANQVISFSAQGTDAGGVTLPASAFTWNIDFLHDGQVQPGIPITGVKSGTFTIPGTGLDFSGNTRYRVTLTVTDSNGLTNISSVVIWPTKVNLSFNTIPSGLTIYLNGIARQTPFVYDTLVGFTHSIEARNQTTSTTTYTFSSWSDGGAQSHSIQVPVAAQSYTATYTATPTPPASAIAHVQSRGLDAGITNHGALAFSSNTTPGNLIIVAVRIGAIGQTVTVSDSAGNTYNRAVQFATSGGDTVAVYYAMNIVGGPNTVGIDLNTNLYTLRFTIHEYRGLAPVSALDQTTVAEGSSTAYSGNVTITQANELLFGVVITPNASTFTAGSGYTLRASATKIGSEDQIVSSVGTYGATFTVSDYASTTAIVTFKAAAP